MRRRARYDASLEDLAGGRVASTTSDPEAREDESVDDDPCVQHGQVRQRNEDDGDHLRGNNHKDRPASDAGLEMFR